MSATPPPQTEGKQRATGVRLLLAAVVLFVIGLVIVLLVDDGTPKGIGVAFMSLASVPAVAGLVLVVISVVAKRSREDKPWA
jgi:hypothetical protein